jgi:hypothetical protein
MEQTARHQAREVIQLHQTIDRMGRMLEGTQRVKIHNGLVGKNSLRRKRQSGMGATRTMYHGG